MKACAVMVSVTTGTLQSSTLLIYVQQQNKPNDAFFFYHRMLRRHWHTVNYLWFLHCNVCHGEFRESGISFLIPLLPDGLLAVFAWIY